MYKIRLPSPYRLGTDMLISCSFRERKEKYLLVRSQWSSVTRTAVSENAPRGSPRCATQPATPVYTQMDVQTIPRSDRATL